jgi:uncharacterized membrane protein
MEESLHHLAEYVALSVNTIAIVGIAIGAIEALVGLVRVGLTDSSAQAKAAVWMRFAGWLIIALTFQLAADIVETTIAPSWDDLGKLATVALIRTFLNFFLGRDMEEIAARGREHDGIHHKAQPAE